MPRPGKPQRTPEELKWPEDREKAFELQRTLQKEIRLIPLRKAPRLVAGVDSAFFGDRIVCVACLYTLPGLELLEENACSGETLFPYIPGLLSFREGPAAIEAVRGLKRRPDVIIFDGQGVAHPRGLGIASYAGFFLNIPSIGCAKTRLVGAHDEPDPVKGSRTPLVHKGKVIGAVLRTQNRVKPLFISPGHLIDIEGSIEVVLAATGKYRLPEPVRCADMLSKLKKKGL